MNNPRRIIIIATVIGISALAGLILYLQSTQVSLTLSRPAIKGMQYAHQTGPLTARYYASGVFHEVDFASGKVKALTSEYLLPNITEVKWGSDAALFKASNYGGVDQLNGTLIKNGLSTRAAYWWQVDFRTQAISLVGNVADMKKNVHGVDDVVWSTNGAEYYFIQSRSAQDPEEVTVLYKASVGSPYTERGIVPATGLVWSDSSKLIYTVDNSIEHTLATMTLDNLATRVLIKKFHGPISVNATGEQALIVPADLSGDTEAVNETNGPLKLVDTKTGMVTTITKKYTGTAIWDQAGTSWLALQRDQEGELLGQGNLDGRNIKSVTVTAEDIKTAPSDPVLIGFSQGTGLVIDSDGTGYLVAKKVPQFKQPIAATSGGPSFEGLDKLITYGLSAPQLQSTKVALKKYAGTLNTSDNKFKISSIVKSPHNPDADADTIRFSVQLGSRPVVLAQLDYFNLTTVQLFLRDSPTGPPVFDSGAVNALAN